MTAKIERLAGAASHTQIDWNKIDWTKVDRSVRRLQARIVKATKEGRWGKVKALQRLLAHSFSGKMMAVRRVTENQGKRTAGVDGITWETPAKKAEAIETLKQQGYQPLPLRRVYIPKKNGKKRPLGIPTLKDRAMQALYKLALEPVAETLADPNSYGFRPDRSVHDAIQACFIDLCHTTSSEWVLEGDIKACFDRISHEWLLIHIPIEKRILRAWLKAGYLEERNWYPTEEGTPQGGIISPLLANLALDGLEAELRKQFPYKSSRTNKKVNFVRYADDFIITGRSKEILMDEVKPLVERYLAARGLELSQAKTRITHIEDGFDFLGHNLRKYRNGRKLKLLIKPSKENIKAFLNKVRNIITNNLTLPADTMVKLLNPVIRGWALFHQHGVSKKVFSSVDYAIYQALWHWCKRRHPKKNHHWIKRKYFCTKGGDNWVFFGVREGKTAHLFKTVSVKITRHIKVKSEANPFDPVWEPYFEHRLDTQMETNLPGRRKLLHLWKQQNGLCLICAQKINRITGWHSHHFVWKSLGGPDGDQNEGLVHPNCHMQVHANGISVSKAAFLRKRFERLELGEGKLSRPVLRGG